MADIHANYAKRQFLVSATSWTPVIAPKKCNGFSLISASGAAFKIRSDVNDETTEQTINPGFGEAVDPAKPGLNFYQARFYGGDTICFVKAQSGTDTIVGTFIS
jgi:hypothetical protein